MVEFDLELLASRSYGLAREYKECPNDSDDTKAKLIGKHLAMMANNDFEEL
jgi:hypothetical protein